MKKQAFGSPGQLALWAATVLWMSISFSARLQAQTLQVALDNSNLVFTTGGTDGIGWGFEPQSGLFGDNTFDGVDSARAGDITDLGETWIETTVVGPGTVSFWWQAYSEPDADYLSFYMGESLIESISGVLPGWPSGWQYRIFDVPAGATTLRWIYRKDFDFTGGTEDTAWVDKVIFRHAPLPSPGEALGFAGLSWTSGGNTNVTAWFGQASEVFDGPLAVQSGDIWHDQTNWLETTFAGVTNVTFFWKVSSETNADYLEFFTNNILAGQISGEVNWQSNFFRFAANTTNTIRWSYRRDFSITAGANCGWVDGLVLAPAPVPVVTYPFELGSARMLPDGRFELSVIGTPGATCRILVTTNLIDWTEMSTVVATGAVTRITDDAAPGYSTRFYRAITP